MKFVVFNRYSRRVMKDCISPYYDYVYTGSRNSKNKSRAIFSYKGHELSFDELSILPVNCDGRVSMLTRVHAVAILEKLDKSTRKVYAADMALSLQLETATVLRWVNKYNGTLLSEIKL